MGTQQPPEFPYKKVALVYRGVPMSTADEIDPTEQAAGFQDFDLDARLLEPLEAMGRAILLWLGESLPGV